ncbi:hypothetical protein M4V62_25950 [Streptomyces durmitorensis]|uniref:Enoyl reductase n=1 Tax=Streptomyces durmitorensis TaxID=319947 RepID=A0ABY4PWN7_9ACTN|nr:hypothetical protein [Streptomyces durmitorensis]UQT58247.1 hypothetical protein M4V62_25950 [Streptomyces durmitorensis]
MNQRRLSRRYVPLLALAVAMAPSVAYAGGGNQGETGAPQAKAGRQDQNLSVETKIQTTVNGAQETAKTGTLTPANSNWDPPACWYEPAYSPKQIQATVKAIRGMKVFGIGDAVGGVFDMYFKEGNPYKNYNLDKQGEGQFWAAAINEKRKDDPEANSCKRMPFWVPTGDTPKEPLAVSPKILAEYAYDELPVPSTEITMAPEGTTKVNLPTWVWLDKAKFKKVSVTASIPGSGLSATATAEPMSLSIKPGTADAETYPASGECPIEDGKIGEPRAKGTPADTLPPCGVQYLRSSGDDSYNLQATVTWKISWTSTTGEGGDLPAGEFGADQPVAVEEVQSINR